MAGAGTVSLCVKQLYDITRKMSGKYIMSQRLVKDKESNTIETKKGQLNRVLILSCKHFKMIDSRGTE